MALENEENNESDDTFSDCLQNDNSKLKQNQDESDEFDFSEKPKRLKLKPSKIQEKAEKKSNNNNDDNNDNDDDNDDGIAIQSNVLSDYLKPTNILSKYQNVRNDVVDDDEEEEDEEEEEEKEWPTSKEELEFNNVTNDMDIINNMDIINQEEEKSDFDPISFDELFLYLMQEANDKIDDDEIIIEDFRNISWFSYLKMFIFGGCSISLKTNKLNEERDNIFKMAKLKLNLKNDIHYQSLITLWMKLTDDQRQCDKTGSHWQQIGFQGNDPSTDIRGCGLFGILQIIYIVENYNDIITKIYLLSIDQHSNFPLIIVSFKITEIIIKLLRSCLMYNNINKNKSVINTINEIYVALFYEFYYCWKYNSRTIRDFDKAYKELNQKAFENYHQLIQKLKIRNDEIQQNHDDDDDNDNDNDKQQVEFQSFKPNTNSEQEKANKNKKRSVYQV